MSFTEAIINRILELCKMNHITPNKLSELSTVPPFYCEKGLTVLFLFIY